MGGQLFWLVCQIYRKKNLFQVVVVKIIGGVIKQTILNEKEINNINLIILSFYKLYYVLKKFKV